MKQLQKVLDFANRAHEGQVRKYTGEPYICHPIEVAKILVGYFCDYTDEMVYAAILHDVVEDTEITLEEVKYNFGIKTSLLVYWLTDVSKAADGNRAVRKLKDRVHTSKAPLEAQIIKCADLISNTQSILEHDKKFARVYLQEKRETLLMMDVQTREEYIWKIAYGICIEGLEVLDNEYY